ncbi:hypothetical protein [Paraburkholderia caffeinilytica]|uniref:hypothetical protein n=1 Tax=Paraburkholderia caffeinilytica TaxID=1761016 RepID=UPI003DA12190
MVTGSKAGKVSDFLQSAGPVSLSRSATNAVAVSQHRIAFDSVLLPILSGRYQREGNQQALAMLAKISAVAKQSKAKQSKASIFPDTTRFAAI